MVPTIMDRTIGSSRTVGEHGGEIRGTSGRLKLALRKSFRFDSLISFLFRLARGTNMCGVANYAAYPTV